MKKSSTIFLQVVLVLMAIGALALLLWEPQLEGRNAHATLSQMYFNDPFLAYIYLGSIPFFTAIFQAFRLLGYIRENKVFSFKSAKTLRTIKYCALAIIGFIVPAEAYLLIARPGDDIAGGVAMGVLIIFISAVIATVAAVFEKTLQSAAEIKSENDLTV